MRPNLELEAEYYHHYMDLVPGDDILTAMVAIHKGTQEFLASIAAEKEDHAYAEGKWTIKEVVQHLIDAERVFGYRALCFARGEAKDLPGFEENDYAPESRTGKRTLREIAEDFQFTRNSTISMFRSFDPEVVNRQGMANNSPMTTLGAGYAIVGHEIHHCNVIKDKYL